MGGEKTNGRRYPLPHGGALRRERQGESTPRLLPFFFFLLLRNLVVVLLTVCKNEIQEKLVLRGKKREETQTLKFYRIYYEEKR